MEIQALHYVSGVAKDTFRGSSAGREFSSTGALPHLLHIELLRYYRGHHKPARIFGIKRRPNHAMLGYLNERLS